MERINTGRRTLISVLTALMIAAAFIPVTSQFALGAEQTPAFDTQGKVTGLHVVNYTYYSVRIGWKSYSKADGYEIYRADKKDGTYKKVKTHPYRTYNDEYVTLSKYRYYKVRAYATVSGKKKYSKFSSIIAARPLLKKPSDVTTVGEYGSTTVKWGGVDGATKYQVYRSDYRNGTYYLKKTTSDKSYTDSSVKTGYRYYYKIRAYRTISGEKKYGPFSEVRSGMGLFSHVKGLKVSVGSSGTVAATWKETTGAYGYQLQRKQYGGEFVTVAYTREHSFKDKLKSSGYYVYRVRAYSYVNGKRQYGYYSTGGRGAALLKARSWVGCKESNGSHKKIIDVYNNYGPSSGRIGYGTPWCAAFVSAVAISTGNTELIPVHSYCPSMLSQFENKTYDKKYTPSSADVIFFDWNYNKVPDHVGMVDYTSGDNVTTIEGNYSDAVKKRTFKKGYSLLLAYGLPNYTIRDAVKYNKTSSVSSSSLADDMAEEACADITEALAENGEDFAEEALPEADAAEAAENPEEALPEENIEPTDVEIAEQIIDYIQEEAPAEEAGVPEEETSTFDAFLAYEICDEMDIDACVVTETDTDGNERSYNEVVLDGELYILDADGVSGGSALEEYTPEEIN